MHIHEGAWARRVQPRIGAKVNNLSLGWLKSGGQHPYPVFHLGCGLSSYRTQRYIIMCILWGVTRTLTELLFDCLEKDHKVLAASNNKSFILPYFGLVVSIGSTSTKRWTWLSGNLGAMILPHLASCQEGWPLQIKRATVKSGCKRT